MPQVIKMLKEKKAEQISFLMLAILLVGVGLWVVYGIMRKDIPVIATNTFSFLMNLIMLFLRIRYAEKK